MLRVLITGGTGFIGSYVVENLKARGHDVVLLDRSGRIREDVDVVLGDIRDAAGVMDAVSHCDAVMHLAGVLGTAETVEEPLPAVETNIIGGLNVFKAVRRYGVPAVNIAAANHWMRNPYSITKKAAERFALMANEEWGTRIALIRALNVYGPGQKAEPIRKLVPNLILPILRGEPVVIFGDGQQVSDMIYVEDVAELLVRALLWEHGCYDSVMEAGTGRATTVLEVAEAVIRELGKGEIDMRPMRPGEIPNSIVLGDPGTLKPLGMKAEDLTTLEEGLGPTIEYYRKTLAH
jgi:UDP-glucose 4-epimerase